MAASGELSLATTTSRRPSDPPKSQSMSTRQFVESSQSAKAPLSDHSSRRHRRRFDGRNASRRFVRNRPVLIVLVELVLLFAGVLAGVSLLHHSPERTALTFHSCRSTSGAAHGGARSFFPSRAPRSRHRAPAVTPSPHPAHRPLQPPFQRRAAKTTLRPRPLPLRPLQSASERDALPKAAVNAGNSEAPRPQRRRGTHPASRYRTASRFPRTKRKPFLCAYFSYCFDCPDSPSLAARPTIRIPPTAAALGTPEAAGSRLDGGHWRHWRSGPAASSCRGGINSRTHRQHHGALDHDGVHERHRHDRDRHG